MAKVIGVQFFIVLAMTLGLLAAIGDTRKLQELSMKERHEQWMSLHGRIYKDEAEQAKRFEIFKRNVQFVETFNRNGNKSYRLGINQFSDLTDEEFTTARNGYKKSPAKVSGSTSFKYENVTEVPSDIDWRKKGAVTPIKDQGRCGSCWAFSAVAAMEGITQLTKGELISLSEQEVIDCDDDGKDHGCNGGQMDGAFEFIIQNQGLTTEDNYPYEGIKGTCNTDKGASPAASIKGYEDVPANNEAALLKAVAHQPISVAIDASGLPFRFYTHGIFKGSCSTHINHAVTVVGYGATDDGTKFWLVKNSWGKYWGESGYIRMERDVEAQEGLCGIAIQPSYPTA